MVPAICGLITLLYSWTIDLAPSFNFYFYFDIWTLRLWTLLLDHNPMIAPMFDRLLSNHLLHRPVSLIHFPSLVLSHLGSWSCLESHLGVQTTRISFCFGLLDQLHYLPHYLISEGAYAFPTSLFFFALILEMFIFRALELMLVFRSWNGECFHHLEFP